MEEKDCDKEEWGGWKFVREMLDNKNEIGIYPTTKCYKKFYDFVVAQKKKAVVEVLRKLEK